MKMVKMITYIYVVGVGPEGRERHGKVEQGTGAERQEHPSWGSRERQSVRQGRQLLGALWDCTAAREPASRRRNIAMRVCCCKETGHLLFQIHNSPCAECSSGGFVVGSRETANQSFCSRRTPKESAFAKSGRSGCHLNSLLLDNFILPSLSRVRSLCSAWSGKSAPAPHFSGRLHAALGATGLQQSPSFMHPCGSSTHKY